jgi:hypothetical protein
MIGQYLPQTNKSVTVAKSKITRPNMYKGHFMDAIILPFEMLRRIFV